jgi:hypothetical protein
LFPLFRLRLGHTAGIPDAIDTFVSASSKWQVEVIPRLVHYEAIIISCLPSIHRFPMTINLHAPDHSPAPDENSEIITELHTSRTAPCPAVCNSSLAHPDCGNRGTSIVPSRSSDIYTEDQRAWTKMPLSVLRSVEPRSTIDSTLQSCQFQVQPTWNLTCRAV